ncbi:MAG TPA: DUF2852 domain-containing protein [Acetobacteraceae bacterium]|nr:DUF2852 domain-containing protein [Acetobacteraceae bacterium]
MPIAERLDEYGKGAWIALTILGFWLCWPIGLAMLIFLACSGRMRAWKYEARGRWYNTSNGGSGWGCGRHRNNDRYPSSGNVAFDEYRRETLRRLEEEQKEFQEYLDKLRAAKDKAEFDQFMSDRRGRPSGEVTA